MNEVIIYFIVYRDNMTSHFFVHLIPEKTDRNSYVELVKNLGESIPVFHLTACLPYIYPL